MTASASFCQIDAYACNLNNNTIGSYCLGPMGGGTCEVECPLHMAFWVAKGHRRETMLYARGFREFRHLFCASRRIVDSGYVSSCVQ